MRPLPNLFLSVAVLLCLGAISGGCERSCPPCNGELSSTKKEASTAPLAPGNYDPFRQDLSLEPPRSIVELNRLAREKRHPRGKIELRGLVVTSKPFAIGKKGLQGRFVADASFSPESGCLMTWKPTDNSPKYGYDPPEMSVGSVIDVTTTFREFCGIRPAYYKHCSAQLELTPYRGTRGEVRVVGNNPKLPEPYEISCKDVVSAGDEARRRKHTLVRVSDVAVTKSKLGYGRFQVAGGVVVDDTLYEYETPLDGTQYESITGFLHVDFGQFRILPRSAADLVEKTSGESASKPLEIMADEGKNVRK